MLASVFGVLALSLLSGIPSLASANSASLVPAKHEVAMPSQYSMYEGDYYLSYDGFEAGRDGWSRVTYSTPFHSSNSFSQDNRDLTSAYFFEDSAQQADLWQGTDYDTNFESGQHAISMELLNGEEDGGLLVRFFFGFFTESELETFTSGMSQWYGGEAVTGDASSDEFIPEYNYYYIAFVLPSVGDSIRFHLGETSYRLIQNFVNCTGYSVDSLHPLPTTYSAPDNPYVCRFTANTGYWFDKRVLSSLISGTSGLTYTNVEFEDVLGTQYYASAFRCSISLPSSNCTLNVTAASMPTFSFTGTFNHSTKHNVSGANSLPTSSYYAPNNPYSVTISCDRGYRLPAWNGTDLSSFISTDCTILSVDGSQKWDNSQDVRSITITLNLPYASNSYLTVTPYQRTAYSLTFNGSHATTIITDNIVYEGESVSLEVSASSGYALNTNGTALSITGTTPSISYSEELFTGFYSKAHVSFMVGQSNIVVSATAVPADYASGYVAGEQSGLELKGGLMDLIPNVFASIGAFFFTFSGVNFMGINLLAVVGIVVSVGLIGVVIKVALK